MAKSRFRQAKGYSEALKKRTEQSSSGSFITIFKDSMNLPIYKEPKEGDVGIDIIPYLATGDHPQAAEGDPVYKLELWVHQMVGPEKGNYVCLRNFNEDCPLCDARYAELAEDTPRKEVTDMLKGSHRVIYNVVVSGEEDKGVQIWTASSYLAEDPFKASAKNRKTGEKIPFACPDNGKTVWFTIQGSRLTKEFAGISLEDRNEEISEDILDEAFELENCIIIPDPEELEKIARVVLGGATDKKEKEPDPPSRRRRGKEDEDPPSRRGRKSEPEDDGETKSEEEPPEDEKPPKRTRRTESKDDDDPPKRTRRTESKDDDDPPARKTRREKSDDSGDEEPPKRTRRRRKD